MKIIVAALTLLITVLPITSFAKTSAAEFKGGYTYSVNHDIDTGFTTKCVKIGPKTLAVLAKFENCGKYTGTKTDGHEKIIGICTKSDGTAAYIFKKKDDCENSKTAWSYAS